MKGKTDSNSDKGTPTSARLGVRVCSQDLHPRSFSDGFEHFSRTPA
jgi:hypothetical protein